MPFKIENLFLGVARACIAYELIIKTLGVVVVGGGRKVPKGAFVPLAPFPSFCHCYWIGDSRILTTTNGDQCVHPVPNDISEDVCSLGNASTSQFTTPQVKGRQLQRIPE